MPRDYLTDEKVIKDCMETYPLPFGLAEKFLNVGTVKKADNFLPIKVEKRMPQPPGRQEFLANALIRAKNEKGALKNMEQVNQIRELVLRERPFYPEYVRGAEEKVDELDDEVRAPDEPIVKQLIDDEEEEDIPEAEAREVLPEAQTVKRTRRTKKQMAEDKAKKDVADGKQQTLEQGFSRGAAVKRRKDLQKRISQLQKSANEEDKQELKALQKNLATLNDELADL